MFATHTMEDLWLGTAANRRSGTLRGIVAVVAIAACGLLAAPSASAATYTSPTPSVEAKDSSVVLSWSTVPFAVQYEWRHRAEGEATWSIWGERFSTNPFNHVATLTETIHNLTNGTTYEFQMRSGYLTEEWWSEDLVYSDVSNTVTATPNCAGCSE